MTTIGSSTSSGHAFFLIVCDTNSFIEVSSPSSSSCIDCQSFTWKIIEGRTSASSLVDPGVSSRFCLFSSLPFVKHRPLDADGFRKKTVEERIGCLKNSLSQSNSLCLSSPLSWDDDATFGWNKDWQEEWEDGYERQESQAWYSSHVATSSHRRSEGETLSCIIIAWRVNPFIILSERLHRRISFSFFATEAKRVESRGSKGRREKRQSMR